MYKFSSGILATAKFKIVSSFSQRVPNHYETLGVKRDCSQDEVKRAFLKLSKKHHPDGKLDELKKHEKFILVNDAYQVLGKIESRRSYDRSLKYQNVQNPNVQYDPKQWKVHHKRYEQKDYTNYSDFERSNEEEEQRKRSTSGPKVPPQFFKFFGLPSELVVVFWATTICASVGTSVGIYYYLKYKSSQESDRYRGYFPLEENEKFVLHASLEEPYEITDLDRRNWNQFGIVPDVAKIRRERRKKKRKERELTE